GVIHDQVRLAKVARRAEGQYATGCAPVERDGRVAEWAEGDRDRHTPDSVIDYLVPDQDLHWICTALGANRQRDHGLGWFEPGAGFGGAHELGAVERWDAVLAWPATADCAQGHAVLVDLALPAVPPPRLTPPPAGRGGGVVGPPPPRGPAAAPAGGDQHRPRAGCPRRSFRVHSPRGLSSSRGSRSVSRCVTQIRLLVMSSTPMAA